MRLKGTYCVVLRNIALAAYAISKEKKIFSPLLEANDLIDIKFFLLTRGLATVS